LHLAGAEGLSPLVAAITPNSDFAPLLDLNGERARYLLTDATGFEHLNSTAFDIVAALTGRRMSLATDDQVLANIPRLYARANSARLRLFANDTSESDGNYDTMEEVRRLFDTQTAAGLAPRDWHRWVSLLYEVNRDVHTGSPGSLDSALFRSIDAFVRRVNAPASVRQSVDFLRAADSWDFAMAQAAGDELIKKLRNGEQWLPPDHLRDATVVAHVANGDAIGAMKMLNAMQPFVSRDPAVDLRTRLLWAHIKKARG